MLQDGIEKAVSEMSHRIAQFRGEARCVTAIELLVELSKNKEALKRFLTRVVVATSKDIHERKQPIKIFELIKRFILISLNNI